MVKQKHAAVKYLLYFVLPLVLLAAGGWYILFGYNSFFLEMELVGEGEMRLEYGEHFRDPGCLVRLKGTKFWKDGIGLNLEAAAESSVNDGKTGKYTVKYDAEYMGISAETVRTVRVVDTECPVITLTPDPETGEPLEKYTEAGFTAWDNYDGDLTDRVVRTQEGERVIYTVIDSSGNPAVAERQISLLDLCPPEILLTGGEKVTSTMGAPYIDPGFRALDDRDGDLTADVESWCGEGEIIPYLPGPYTIHYRVNDSSGNTAEATRSVLLEPCPRPLVIYPKGKTIYLTFDDGPCPDTQRLLDILKKYNVRATFFVIGGDRDVMRRIVQEGHSIGLHAMNHNYNRLYQSFDGYFEDLYSLQKYVLDATGTETWLVRFPGGSSNTVSSFNKGIMTQLTQAVEDCGFAYFDWNVDSRDASNATTRAAVLRNVKEGIAENTYSIVLQHDIHPFSVDAVEEIIVWGLENGYRFLPLQIDSPPIHHPVRN